MLDCWMAGLLLGCWIAGWAAGLLDCWVAGLLGCLIEILMLTLIFI
jgi:hypothetical protein